MFLRSLHHIAIICSDYEKSRYFYTSVLGLEVVREIFREERGSYKCDLALNGIYLIELFSFPDPPARPSYPEASGLRHMAFGVDDLDSAMTRLESMGVACETARVDSFTGKRFTFFADPDNLPIELYENE